jgi:hypothetical protein
MANKLSTVLGAIKAKLEELVADGTVKKIRRRPIIAPQENNPPVVGLVLDKFKRAGRNWDATALVMIVVKAGEGEAEEAAVEMVKLVDGKIDAAAKSGTAGGAIDTPEWQTWAIPAGEDTGLQIAGALGTVRLRVDGL